MSSLKRDTEHCVYIRFQVSVDRIESFGRMFSSATKLDFRDSLRGMAKDSGNAHLTVAIAPESNTEPARRHFAGQLNAMFVKLFDFYPSISEKPSELQMSMALSHLQSTAEVPKVATTRSLSHSTISH